jgi:hypothetical protein
VWSLALWSRGWGAELPGGEAFVEAVTRQAWRQTILIGASLVALALAVQRRGVYAWLPVALLALDLAVMGQVFNPFPVQHAAFPSTPALEFLAAREGRVAVLGTPNVLPPSAAGTHGIRSVHGVAPMVPRNTAELLGVVEADLLDPADPRLLKPFTDANSMDHPILDLLGVRSIVYGDPAYTAQLDQPLIFRDETDGIAIHDREYGGPRAFICGGAQVVPKREDRLVLLGDPDFDVHGSVLLETDSGMDLPAVGAMRPVPVTPLTPVAFRLAVDSPFRGIVVFTESWDPGWHVTVDGVARRVLLADHALLGVAMEAGHHDVLFTYLPPSATLGRLLSLVGLAALVLMGWRAWRHAGESNATRNDSASSTSSGTNPVR